MNTTKEKISSGEDIFPEDTCMSTTNSLPYESELHNKTSKLSPTEFLAFLERELN